MCIYKDADTISYCMVLRTNPDRFAYEAAFLLHEVMPKVWIVLFLLFFPFQTIAETDVFFTPSKACENLIIQKIEHSTKKIDIAIYSFTHPLIANSLKKAHNKGIKIRLLVDRVRAKTKSSQTHSLKRENIPVRLHIKHQKQHNKFAIFDNNDVITGSYNWTISASKRNDENCLLITNDPKTLKKYQTYFNTLWNLNKGTDYDQKNQSIQ